MVGRDGRMGRMRGRMGRWVRGWVEVGVKNGEMPQALPYGLNLFWLFMIGLHNLRPFWL